MSNSFPAQARAVVIGGGIMGCSVAYHLAVLGWKDVVILERASLMAAASAGSIKRWNGKVQSRRWTWNNPGIMPGVAAAPIPTWNSWVVVPKSARTAWKSTSPCGFLWLRGRRPCKAPRGPDG